MTNKDLSVIIPVFNESSNLDELYQRLTDTLKSITDSYEIIFINDGSTDNSASKILEFAELNEKIFYINFSRNFGHQVAVSAGLKHCKSKCTVIIDSDLQDPPELIKSMYATYEKGYDVVYAKRDGRKGESALKKLTAKLFYRILNKLTKVDIPVDTGDFRLIDQKVVNVLNKMKEQDKFLRGQIAWIGLKQTHVLFQRESRKGGTSSYSYSKMFKLAFDGITGFSDKPLLFVSRLGFIISFFSFLVILFAIFSHFILKQTITGWTSLIISVMFIGGIQLISIGIIGEYISRINNNVKERPLYVIASTNLKLEEA
ncbi:MAG: glycosyltransferase family 2 protein [Winogradskyella sp.]|nr:glycosyltransferase family 2 protein [Winogradskyella sp.]NNK39666.1 glycosyltransferase family 2 protein [Winogradskyella sp.]